MPVEITNKLTPEMQAVSDCREAVKKAEAEVERCKGELKVAKALWETAVDELNTAIDAAIDAERQPTLFNRFGGDDLSNPPTPAATTPDDPAPAGDGSGEGSGEILDAEWTVNPESVPSLPPAVPSAGALPAATAKAASAGSVPGWRPLLVADHLEGDEIPARTVDKILTALGVHVTCGQLADQLLAHGNRPPAPFGLTVLEWQAVCEAVEMMSEDDDEPIRFGDDEGEEAEKAEEVDEILRKTGKKSKRKSAKKGA